MLFTSNFSFSHSVFYPFGELSVIFSNSKLSSTTFFQFRKVENLSFGKVLTFYQTIPRFNDPVKGIFLKQCGKRRMLVTSIFSFSHNVFHTFNERNQHFSNIRFVVCKYFRFGLGQNFVVWLTLSQTTNFRPPN